MNEQGLECVVKDIAPQAVITMIIKQILPDWLQILSLNVVVASLCNMCQNS